MKAVVAAFNQEKALVGAFSVIMNLRMEFFEALISSLTRYLSLLVNHKPGEPVPHFSVRLGRVEAALLHGLFFSFCLYFHVQPCQCKCKVERFNDVTNYKSGDPEKIS